MSRYKLNILTLRGQPLTFTISDYTIIKGDFIEFIDERTNRKLTFHCSRVEIETLKEDRQ